MRDPKEYPAPDKLADDEDELSWDRERDGRMADAATDDDAVSASVYEGEDDDASSD